MILDIEIEVPVHTCWNADGGGHMHFMATLCEIKDKDGNVVGEIGQDPSATLIFWRGKERYHIQGLDLWRALNAAIPKPDPVEHS